MRNFSVLAAIVLPFLTVQACNDGGGGPASGGTDTDAATDSGITGTTGTSDSSDSTTGASDSGTATDATTTTDTTAGTDSGDVLAVFDRDILGIDTRLGFLERTTDVDQACK